MSRITQAQINRLFSSKERTSAVVTITPKMASEWLETRNSCNRRISNKHVKMLSRAMTQGRWRLTHQGIAFDERGMLIDGQHRLLASVDSNVAVQILVTFCASFEDMLVCDRSRVRSAKDALRIQSGRENGALRAAVIRILLIVENDDINYKADDQEIVQEDIRYDEVLTWFASNAQSKLWYAPFAAAIIYARTRTPDKAEEFLNSLESGANLPDRSPVIAARTLVDAMHGRGGNSARLIIFRKMLRAIAAFCKGEKVVRLHDSDEGLKYFAGFSDLTVSDEENEEAPCEAV